MYKIVKETQGTIEMTITIDETAEQGRVQTRLNGEFNLITYGSAFSTLAQLLREDFGLTDRELVDFIGDFVFNIPTVDKKFH